MDSIISPGRHEARNMGGKKPYMEALTSFSIYLKSYPIVSNMNTLDVIIILLLTMTGISIIT